MIRPTLAIGSLSSVSPTLAETMRSCMLRAGLSRATGIASYVIGNPKAWLGTAYHEVLRSVVRERNCGQPLEQIIDRLWNSTIERLHREAVGHSLNSRFGQPETWPGYHLARATVAIRANEIIASIGDSQESGTYTPTGSRLQTVREQELSACEGKLTGKPDVIDGDSIFEYKTGSIFETEPGREGEVKASFVRQLKIYGYLVREALGRSPRRGVILPLAGKAIEVALRTDECERAAIEAVQVLDRYNAKVANEDSIESFATPSPANCHFCPYKIMCPAFWMAATPDWTDKLDGAVIEGHIEGNPETIHARSGWAAHVGVVSGTVARGTWRLGPVPLDAFPQALRFGDGIKLRGVGLRVLAPSSIAPTLRSVLEPVNEIPLVYLNVVR